MRQDSRDLDGDSEMASSADSVHTDSDYAHDGAHTPTNAQVTSDVAASELSPPGSQSQNAPSTSELKTAGLDLAQPSRKGSEDLAAAWKNKRSHDEYLRAMESVIDRDFNLST